MSKKYDVLSATEMIKLINGLKHVYEEQIKKLEIKIKALNDIIINLEVDI
jgi:hypothetical protein